MLKTEERPEIKENLEEILSVCENIRLKPPKTFHEVCQWTAFFNCASRVCTRDGAGFQLDTILYPYYERDVKAGILDDEKAKFLIADLLLIDPHYYQISGVDGAGLVVVADSFGALETRVENEKILIRDEMYEALDNDFEDERARLILNSSSKYCEGNTASDKWAKRLTESWVRNIKNQEMPNGRCLIPGWFSWARTIEYGSKEGATPNGRRKSEPISHGANPNPHFRADGAPDRTVKRNCIGAVRIRQYGTASD